MLGLVLSFSVRSWRPQCKEYGVREILGITAGYNGLSDPETHPPVKLTEEMVRDIHMKGGSIIKAARQSRPRVPPLVKLGPGHVRAFHQFSSCHEEEASET